MSPIGKRIKARREELQLTQEQLAARLGYKSKSTINKIEMGINDITQSKIIAFADALNTTSAYLMGWSDDIPNNAMDFSAYGLLPIETKRFPLLGETVCGKPIFAVEDRESYFEAGTNIKADFCLKAKDDSMINARIHDGDIVFIRKQGMVENGDIAAVIIDDDATLKRVYLNQQRTKLSLNAENPKYEPLIYVGEEFNRVEILGKAVAFQSDIK